MIPPEISRYMTPSFYKLDPMQFQALCRDLYAREEHVATCDESGLQGQRQWGIDVEAVRKDHNGIDVGQCKCYEDFPPAKIKKASDEFLDHWESHWSKENVNTFVLFVACDLEETKRRQEIAAQRKRFRELDVDYLVWTGTNLAGKLGLHPDIVMKHLVDPLWVERLCGIVQPRAWPTSGVGKQGHNTVSEAALITQNEAISAKLSELTRDHVEAVRRLWREGHVGTAIRELNRLKADSGTWRVLAAEIKADLLRLEAGLVLATKNDAGRAGELAEEARGLSPSSWDRRIAAFIAYRVDGPRKAADMLSDLADEESGSSRAAYLLELGDLEECGRVLSPHNVDASENAELLRVSALYHLLSKQADKARLQILKALQIAPGWKSVRLASGLIDYYSGLAAVAVPKRLGLGPEPVDPSLVKSDSRSVERRRQAADIFKDLAIETSDRGEEHRYFETLRLACLADDFETRSQAEGYCRSLLASDPTHCPAIFWAAARSLGVNLGASKKALAALVRQGKADIATVLALVSCHISTGTPRQGLKLLREQRAVFVSSGNEESWALWSIKTALAAKEVRKALEILNAHGTTDDFGHAKTAVLHALASETGDWSELAGHLKSSYEAAGDPVFLLDFCRVAASYGEWGRVAERAEELVRALGTGDVVRLASLAAHNAGEYELALRLLDDYQDHFLGTTLSADFRRLRISSHRGLGVISRAIAEAEKLAEEEPTVENMLALAEMYLTKGNLKGLAMLGRHLLAQPGLNSRRCIQMAWAIHSEDQALAVEFWRRALREGLDDDEVGIAIGLGFQLGLDDQMAALVRRLGQLGEEGRGGIQVVNISEFPSMAANYQEQLKRADEAYRNATVPVHLVAKHTNIPLVNFYHIALASNEGNPQPTTQSRLLARHGGRTLAPGFPEARPNWRLNMDVTAVLLAAHLGILEDVEKPFAPIRIPPDLTRSLLRMRDRLLPSQPAHLEAHKLVLDLVEKGAIGVVAPDLSQSQPPSQVAEELGEAWAALYDEVRREGGYVVDFLPLRKQDLSGLVTPLPDDGDRYVINCRAVVESLRQAGPLTEEQAALAIDHLGNGGEEPLNVAPVQGSRLLCHANIPEVLAGAGVLAEASSRFAISIEKSELERAQAEKKAYEAQRVEVDWLERLIDRIDKGLESDTYRLVPLGQVSKEGLDEEERRDPDFSCLAALLQMRAEPGDVIWADDRMLTSYPAGVNLPVIGVNEVLKALVGGKVIGESRYYQLLTRLRAANARFIPVEPEEILHHLNDARIENGVLVETGPLTVLRKYVAACLLDGELIQRPPLPSNVPNPGGEVAFVLGLGSAISEALVEVWESDESDEACSARAGWLRGNLYMDHLGLVSTTWLRKPEHDDLYLSALGYVQLITRALGAGPLRLEQGAPTKGRSLSWLEDHLFWEAFGTSPALVRAIANELKDLFTGRLEEVKGTDHHEKMVLVLGLYFHRLPEPVREELGRDSDFLSRLGLFSFSAMSIGEFTFSPDELWRVATEAVNGREAVITPRESEAQITVRPMKGGRAGFSFAHPSTGVEVVVAGDEFRVLSDLAAEREAALRAHREWFDCAEEGFEDAVAAIAGDEVPERRMALLEDWRKASGDLYYRRLGAQLKKEPRFKDSDLVPPSVEGLLRHYRLQSVSGDSEFQMALSGAAAALLAEEGLAEAVIRLARLPVPLPNLLLGEVAALDAPARRALVKQLLKVPCSPVSRIHLLRLLFSLGKNAEVYRRIALRIAAKLISQEEAEAFRAFHALLQWVNEEFEYRYRDYPWSPAIRLAIAWAHGHQLFTIFREVGAPNGWLAETFSTPRRRVPLEAFERNLERWFDVAHPHRVDRLTFSLAGLCYALGDSGADLRQLAPLQALAGDEDITVALRSLLRDRSLAHDNLGSFLLADYGENLGTVISVEDAEAFNPAASHARVGQVIQALEETKGNSEAWIGIEAMIGDLPCYPDLAPRLRDLLQQVDFAKLSEADETNAIAALRVGSQHAVHLRDAELTRHLKEQLQKSAGVFVARHPNRLNMLVRPGPDNANWAAHHLLDVALNLALASSSSPGESMAAFGELVAGLTRVWPGLIPLYRQIIERLCMGLPVPYVRDLWPVLIRLRAED